MVGVCVIKVEARWMFSGLFHISLALLGSVGYIHK